MQAPESPKALESPEKTAPLRPSGHVFIATSLDGFIARPDGGLDWLPQPKPQPEPQPEPGEDYGHGAFLAGIDGLIMGRKTFETVLGFGIDWPYAKPVMVLSTSLDPGALPADLAGRVRLHSGNPASAMAAAADLGWRRVGLDGGELIRGALIAGLVETLIVTQVPVLIGSGRPLFGALPGGDIALELQASRAWPNGLVQSQYRLAPKA